MKKKVAKINENCINCGMCHEICTFDAIVEAGDKGQNFDKNTEYSDEHYFVNTEKCAGCCRCCNVCPIKNIEIKEIDC